MLLHEAVEALAIRADGLYVDGTFGRGGHAAAILRELGDEGRLLAIDRDPLAIAWAEQRFATETRLIVKKASFSAMKKMVREQFGNRSVDGILLDLGVSSPQLEDAERGFSFQLDGALDMRMDPETGISASEWLRTASEKEIGEVLRDYGGERHWRRIARIIVGARRRKPINRAGELANLIASGVPRRERHKHPATRTFQAIRIFINRELEELQSCLEQIPELLTPGGRLCVISFHSLEHRLVKHFIRHATGLPDSPATLRAVGRPIRPGTAEVAANPRARSAFLRVAERVS